MTPPALTTKRLFTPVIATRPTFWANALWVKPLKIGEMTEEAMSARRPFPIRLRSTEVLTISPTARMSAVVSVMMTRTTMAIDTMPARVNVGRPKANGVGNATMGPLPTPEKSAIPMIAETTVPMMIENSIDSREIAGMFARLSTITTSSVNPASAMFWTEPYVGSFELLPIAQFAATGIRLSPIVVITVPVTTGGKNLMIRAKNGVISKPMAAEAITAPNAAGSPPPWVTIAVSVATLAKDVPCTSGSWDPNHGTPIDCSRVARPPMNRQLATSRPSWAGGTPAAPPMISGGAMMPPYMVRTCWAP